MTREFYCLLDAYCSVISILNSTFRMNWSFFLGVFIGENNVIRCIILSGICTHVPGTSHHLCTVLSRIGLDFRPVKYTE